VEAAAAQAREIFWETTGMDRPKSPSLPRVSCSGYRLGKRYFAHPEFQLAHAVMGTFRFPP
jgi:hypothetical protein